MDNFCEQLVVREKTGSDRSKYIVTLAGGVIVTVLLVITAFLMMNIPLMTFAGLVLAVGAGYGTYFLTQDMQVEYEYTYTNGELDIDKIIAKKKRKSMLSVSISKFTDFGKYTEDTPEETEDMTIVIASSNISSKEYYADFSHEEYGDTRLVFCPDEKMLENIVRSLPRNLKGKVKSIE